MRLSCTLVVGMIVALVAQDGSRSIAPEMTVSLTVAGRATEASVTGIRDQPGYSLYVIVTADGPICGVVDDEPVAAIPLKGQWDDRAEWSPQGITFACVSGAIGKCVTWGYRPWAPGMRDYHQACIRMVRADYCGDGVGHTRDGTPIDLWDVNGFIRRDGVPGMQIEATWGPKGATHIWRTRYPAGEADVLRTCPDRMSRASRNRPWLLANASYPEP